MNYISYELLYTQQNGGAIMKFYCIGDQFPLVKVGFSANCLDNIPYFSTPMYGLLPVTEGKLRRVFQSSEQLILCYSLCEAEKLRIANMMSTNSATMHADLCKGALAEGYPYGDHAIYEIEVDDHIPLIFSKLKIAPVDELQFMVDDERYFKALNENDRSEIPDIEVCRVDKTAINPTLLACHYFSWKTAREEVVPRSACTII